MANMQLFSCVLLFFLFLGRTAFTLHCDVAGLNRFLYNAKKLNYFVLVTSQDIHGHFKRFHSVLESSRPLTLFLLNRHHQQQRQQQNTLGPIEVQYLVRPFILFIFLHNSNTLFLPRCPLQRKLWQCFHTYFAVFLQNYILKNFIEFYLFSIERLQNFCKGDTLFNHDEITIKTFWAYLCQDFLRYDYSQQCLLVLDKLNDRTQLFMHPFLLEIRGKYPRFFKDQTESSYFLSAEFLLAVSDGLCPKREPRSSSSQSKMILSHHDFKYSNLNELHVLITALYSSCVSILDEMLDWQFYYELSLKQIFLIEILKIIDSVPLLEKKGTLDDFKKVVDVFLEAFPEVHSKIKYQKHLNCHFNNISNTIRKIKAFKLESVQILTLGTISETSKVPRESFTKESRSRNNAGSRNKAALEKCKIIFKKVRETLESRQDSSIFESSKYLVNANQETMFASVQVILKKASVDFVPEEVLLSSLKDFLGYQAKKNNNVPISILAFEEHYKDIFIEYISVFLFNHWYPERKAILGSKHAIFNRLEKSFKDWRFYLYFYTPLFMKEIEATLKLVQNVVDEKQLLQIFVNAILQVDVFISSDVAIDIDKIMYRFKINAPAILDRHPLNSIDASRGWHAVAGVIKNHRATKSLLQENTYYEMQLKDKKKTIISVKQGEMEGFSTLPMVHLYFCLEADWKFIIENCSNLEFRGYSLKNDKDVIWMLVMQAIGLTNGFQKQLDPVDYLTNPELKFSSLPTVVTEPLICYFLEKSQLTDDFSCNHCVGKYSKFPSTISRYPKYSKDLSNIFFSCLLYKPLKALETFTTYLGVIAIQMEPSSLLHLPREEVLKRLLRIASQYPKEIEGSHCHILIFELLQEEWLRKTEAMEVPVDIEALYRRTFLKQGDLLTDLEKSNLLQWKILQTSHINTITKEYLEEPFLFLRWMDIFISVINQ